MTRNEISCRHSIILTATEENEHCGFIVYMNAIKTYEAKIERERKSRVKSSQVKLIPKFWLANIVFAIAM